MSVIKDWTARLRSGNDRQCKGTLRNSVGFCCLGVATDMAIVANQADGTWVDIAGPDFVSWVWGDRQGRNESSTLPNPVREWLGLVHENPCFNIHFTDDDVKDDWNDVKDYVWIQPDGTTRGIGFMNREERRNQFGQNFSLAELNDSGFTFEQIADIIDYFFEDGSVHRPRVAGCIATPEYITLDRQAA